MASIVIASFNKLTPLWTFGGATCYLRLYYTKTFTDSDAEIHLQGSLENPQQSVPCSIASGMITIPPITLDTTTDGTPHSSSITAVFFDATGIKRTTFCYKFRLPKSLAPATTWPAIFSYNNPSPVLPEQYYDKDQVDLLVAEGIAQIPEVTGTTLFKTYENDLTVAINEIGSTPTTLIIDEDTLLDTAITVPPTLLLDFRNKASIKKTFAFGAIEFEGEGIAYDTLSQMFNGFDAGDITWTGAYPPVFRPEWWGGIADNATDCLTAFDSLLAAMIMPQPQSPTVPVGGKIVLNSGTYYLSDTWHVRRSVSIEGITTADYNAFGTVMRFPAGKTGIIAHAGTTYDGVIGNPYLTSYGSEILGIQISGDGPGTANNTVVSTNGLNITLTGGAITAVSRQGDNAGSHTCVSPGSTISLNGCEYVVSDALSATSTATVPIDPPRLYFNAVNTTTITEAAGAPWPSNNDWAGQTLRIDGVDYTIVSNTTNQITTSVAVPTGLWTGTITTGLKVMAAQNARLNIYHGLDLRVNWKVRSCHIYNFAGNGIDMNSERYPSAYIGTEPNMNNALLERTNCDFNKGSGFAWYGINTNNFETRSINAENNGGYGFYEMGTLGANHYSFHNAYNHNGAFKMAGAGASNQIMNCYTEGGQASALIGPYTLVLGGVHGAGIDYDMSVGSHVAVSEGNLQTQNGMQFRKFATKYNTINVPKSFILQLNSINDPSTLLGFGAGEDAVNTGAGYPAANPRLSSYFFTYNEYDTGWFNLGYGTNYATTNRLVALSGSMASEGAGKLAFPSGFRTQKGDPQITRILKGSVTINPANVAANTVATQTFTLTGAVTNDSLVLNVPTAGLTAGMLVLQSWVSAADQISVTFYNTTGGGIDEASASWNYILFR